MTRAQRVLEEALELPPQERADVAAELLASLSDEPANDPSEVEEAWALEIERRARRALPRQSAGIPSEGVRRNLHDRMPEH